MFIVAGYRCRLGCANIKKNKFITPRPLQESLPCVRYTGTTDFRINISCTVAANDLPLCLLLLDTDADWVVLILRRTSLLHPDHYKSRYHAYVIQGQQIAA